MTVLCAWILFRRPVKDLPPRQQLARHAQRLDTPLPGLDRLSKSLDTSYVSREKPVNGRDAPNELVA